MVGAAFIHFALVELRPVIAVGISSLSIYSTMIQQTYNSEVACICMPGCTQQQTIDQNNNLIRSAMTSFSPTFNATSSCMSVQIGNGFRYGPLFYAFLLVAWGIVFSMCIVMFVVEACNQRCTSIQSGAYFAFYPDLERRCLYRVFIWTYIFSLIVVFLVGIVVILLQSNMNFQLMWTIAQREILLLLVLLLSSQHLLSPTNLKELVCFRRSCNSLLVDSNEME